MFYGEPLRTSPWVKLFHHSYLQTASVIAGGILLSILATRVSGYAQEHAHGAAPTSEPSTERAGRPVADIKSLKTTHGLKIALARLLDEEVPITLDGILDEPIWEKTQLNTAFLQREPQEADPSTERTEFRLLYDRKNLYIGIICYDTDSDKILATERQRDGRMQNDDTVAILLDTFHDHRNFFLFQTNPLGTQHDAQDTDEGRDHNVGWDAEWEVAAKMIPEVGWSAEFSIPFKSLRVPGTEAQVWGLEVERIIRRNNEFTYWNGFKRGFKRENISQGGHLHGIEGFDPGFRLRMKPFSVAGFTRSSNRAAADTDHAMDGGLEILKYRLTPSLMADFTANSNFIDTEIDNQQVNLDRWSLYYPEKREFFQEAGIFKFGVAQGEMPAPDVALFHPRQIGFYSKREGIASRQIVVPITAGARLTGKLAGFSVGMLDVQTGEVPAEGLPESNYGVVRIKRDILGRSSVGGFFLNREIAGTSDYSRVYGVDTNFVFKEHFFTNFLYARSLQPGSGMDQDNWTMSGGAKWDGDFLFAGLEYLVLDPNFRDDLGFIPRPNQRRLSPLIDIKPRIERISHIVRRFQFGVRIDYVTDQEYNLRTRYQHYNAQIFFQSGDQILIAPHRRYEKVEEEFQLRRKVRIPAGSYNMSNLRIAYTVNPARRISGAYVFQPQWGFFGGDLYQFQVRPRINVSQSLSLTPAYNANVARFPQGNFVDHMPNLGIDYAWSNRWLTSTVVQYNNADSSLAAQFRLNYIFRPGDDFFLVYSLGRATGGTRLGQTDQTLAAKLTYSFDY